MARDWPQVSAWCLRPPCIIYLPQWGKGQHHLVDLNKTSRRYHHSHTSHITHFYLSPFLDI